MILDKLSKKAKQELLKMLDDKSNIVQCKIGEFVNIANELDKRGFYEAVEVIDDFIKRSIKNTYELGRIHAYVLRKTRRQ